MVSRKIARRCPICSVSLLILYLSILTPAVRSSDQTLKQWHRPRSDLQQSYEHTFRNCYVHIKCLTEKSLWMTDRLDQTLKSYIGQNRVRTIYDNGNQSELIPISERCSLHYLLRSYNSGWRETYDYMNFKIPNFIARRTFQTALIHVIDGCPLSLPVNAQDEAFQWTDGHSLFLDSRTGWLYFRNVRGDWNAWDRSQDHKGLISSKMGGKWDKKKSTAKIAILTKYTQLMLSHEEHTRRCAFLKLLRSKQPRLCTKEIIMAEVAAEFLNFTTVYPSDLLNRSGYPSGKIVPIHSDQLVLDLPQNVLNDFFQLIYVYDHLFVYCTYNLRSRSMSIAVWFFPFDVLSWVVVVVILCLFWVLQIVSSRSPCTLQAISESLLVIFQILFRQGQSKPKRLSMLFVAFFLIFSFFYENIITSSLIAPSEETPFQNISEAINAGYILDRNFEDYVIRMMYLHISKQTEDFIKLIDSEMFPDNTRYIYTFETLDDMNSLFNVYKEIKHPYKCMLTEEGNRTFSIFMETRSGMKTQLAPVFEWIDAAGLFIPFRHLSLNAVELGRRGIQQSLKSSKGKEVSYLEGNLLTLSNLVPLFIASAIACIVAGFIFLFECKGHGWKASLVNFLALTRFQLVRVGHFIRLFVYLIIGYVASQWTNMLLYCSNKMNRISIRRSMNPIIWVKSNS
jgi:hypothetical protein